MLTDDLNAYAIKYSNETGVSAVIHPDDFIYQFLLNNPSFETRENAVRYYFVDGQRSAGKLDELLFSDLGLSRDSTTILEFAAGYGCVTRHLKKTVPAKNLVSADIHGEANRFIS